MKINRWWQMLCVLQAFDLLSTYLGLRLGAIEQNPVGVAALGWGFGGLILMKCLSMLVAFGIAWLLLRTGHPAKAKSGIALGAVMMMGIVLWNIAAIAIRVLGNQG